MTATVGTAATGSCPIADQCVAYVERFAALPSGIPAAKDIPAAVLAHGWTEAAAPQPNALAVWQPGHGGADADGHVAWIESVSRGFFTISEQNFVGPGGGGCGVVDSRVVAFVPGDVAILVPPSSALLAGATLTSTGSTETAAQAVQAETLAGFSLASTGAALKAGAKADATGVASWLQRQSLPLGVAAVVLWILFAPRRGRTS